MKYTERKICVCEHPWADHDGKCKAYVEPVPGPDGRRSAFSEHCACVLDAPRLPWHSRFWCWLLRGCKYPPDTRELGVLESILCQTRIAACVRCGFERRVRGPWVVYGMRTATLNEEWKTS